MTELATAILGFIESGANPALRADAFPGILWATGFSLDRVPISEVEAALTELMDAGRVEKLWERGRAFFQAVASRPPISDDLRVTRRGLK